jgi:DUF4097 and DUF4098 domain-containing protein YvlB
MAEKGIGVAPVIGVPAREVPGVAGSWWKLAAVIVASLLLFGVGCVDVGPTETRDDSFTVGESARLVVSSENGYIRVTGGDDNQVHVKATLRGVDTIEYEVSQRGDTIDVDAKTQDAWWHRNRSRVEINITAPTSSRMTLETTNGAIEVRDIDGSGSLETSNGMIVLSNVTGDFNGSTSNGRIEVNGLEGSVTVFSSNGEADLWGVKGDVNIETSNGSISFSGEMSAGGTNWLVTSNGDVNVELLGVPSVDLDASTSNGSVTSELEIVATTAEEDQLIGKVGQGQAKLKIVTSNGDIIVR